MKTFLYRGPALLGVLLTLGLILGCSPPPSKRQFNDRIVAANKTLSKASVTFRKAVEPLREGKAVSAPAARGALNTAASALADIKEEYEDPAYPRKSGPAEEYAAEYKKFLATQDQILELMTAIVKAIEDPKVTINQKWLVAQARFKQINDLEKTSFEALKKAQAAYAESHSFKLVQNYD